MFNNDFNGYAVRLENELQDIRRFNLSAIFPQDVFDSTFTNVVAAFDTNNSPKTTGSIVALEALLDRLLAQYANPNSAEERDFKKRLEGLKNKFSDGSDNRIEAEELIWIFDKKRWPNDITIRQAVKKLKELIQRGYFGCTVQGCYIHNHKLIGLFTKNIDMNSYADVLSVFVHELFHALHHHYLDIYGRGEALTEYYHVVVLEALATYFQIMYLEYKGYGNKAAEIKRDVMSHSPIFYPYSGCRSLFYVNTLFNEVLDLTKTDFEQALRKLVNRCEAEIILQKKGYRGSDDSLKRITAGTVKSGSTPNVILSDGLSDGITVDSARDVLRSVFGNEQQKTCDGGIIVNGRIIRFYIVGQTRSYEIESARGHIYALQTGYPTMRNVRPGDMIFSCQRAQIKSVNVALESARETFGTEKGLRIDCLYNELKYPLNLVPLRPRLAGLSPFNSKNGTMPQRGYIHKLDNRAAEIILEEIKRLGNKP